jgi:hypothetical protein
MWKRLRPCAGGICLLIRRLYRAVAFVTGLMAGGVFKSGWRLEAGLRGQAESAPLVG